MDLWLGRVPPRVRDYDLIHVMPHGGCWPLADRRDDGQKRMGFEACLIIHTVTGEATGKSGAGVPLLVAEALRVADEAPGR